jgi:hypothetical protein
MLTPVKNYSALLHTQKKHKTLIIADLHLGWEINLIKKGIHVPSQTSKILQKLIQLINKTRPNTLIILGDVKHTIAKAEPGEWKDIPEFFETLKSKIVKVEIIRGNHDGNLEPLLPPNIQLHPSTGITLNTIGLFHGHTWPAKKLLTCDTLVMGHAHPTVAFRDNLGFQITTSVWIKAKCDTKKLAAAYVNRKHIKTTGDPVTAFKTHFNMKPKAKQLFIMPCFNDFLGGRPVNKKRKNRSYIGPVLRSEAVNMDKAEVYLLDGTFLGTIQQLKALS